MKKTLRLKATSIVMSLAMALTALPVNVFAETDGSSHVTYGAQTVQEDVIRLPIVIRDAWYDGLMFENNDLNFNWDAPEDGGVAKTAYVSNMVEPLLKDGVPCFSNKYTEGNYRMPPVGEGMVQGSNNVLWYLAEKIKTVENIDKCIIRIEEFANNSPTLNEVRRLCLSNSSPDPMKWIATEDAAQVIFYDRSIEKLEEAQNRFEVARWLLNHLFKDGSYIDDQGHTQYYTRSNEYYDTLVLQPETYTSVRDSNKQIKGYSYVSKDRWTDFNLSTGVIQNVGENQGGKNYTWCNNEEVGGWFPMHEELAGQANDPDKFFWFGLEPVAVYGGSNYSTTTAGSGQFVYHKDDDLFFAFSGDDDVFLYINDILVIDNGGTHVEMKSEVFLEDEWGTGALVTQQRVSGKSSHMPGETWAEYLGLEEGKAYNFNFFQMERKEVASNFAMHTNINVVNSSAVPQKKAYDSNGELSYGQSVAAGTDITYEFVLSNNSPVLGSLGKKFGTLPKEAGKEYDVQNADFEQGDRGWQTIGNTVFDVFGADRDTFWAENFPFYKESGNFLSGIEHESEGGGGAKRSSDFTLAGDGYIAFLIGGAMNVQKGCVKLFCTDDNVNPVRIYTNEQWQPWVAERFLRIYDRLEEKYLGKTFYFVVEKGSDTSDYSHINVDDFHTSMTKEEANQLKIADLARVDELSRRFGDSATDEFRKLYETSKLYGTNVNIGEEDTMIFEEDTVVTNLTFSDPMLGVNFTENELAYGDFGTTIDDLRVKGPLDQEYHIISEEDLKQLLKNGLKPNESISIKGFKYKIRGENDDVIKNVLTTTVQGTVNGQKKNIVGTADMELVVTFEPMKAEPVIFVEANATNPTVYKPNGITITQATLQSGPNDGSMVAENSTDSSKLDVKAVSPNEEYVYDIVGTDEAGNPLAEGSILKVYTYAATDKVYVFDYGLKSDIADTSHNNGLFQGGVFYNTEAQKTAGYRTSATLGAISDNGATPQTDITMNSNDVTINEDGSATASVTFEPKGFMSQVENYNYTAKIAKANTEFDAGNPETGTVVNGTIQVMPASVVYYEDNFNSGAQTNDSSMKILYTGDHTPEGTSLNLVQSNGQTEQYGHDDAYNTAENQQDSGGSSTKLTADGYNTKAIFTFTGTGFDILARTSTETAGIVYSIEKYDQSTGKYSFFRMGAVDTYYINGALYQLPVIHEEGMAHGTYRVTLGIKQTGNLLITKDEDGNVIKTEDSRKYVVYLDGIRIYNPLGESGDRAYLADEQDVTVSEIPGLIAGDGTVTDKGMLDEEGNIINSQVVDGATAAIASYSGDSLSALGTTWGEVSTDLSSASNASILTYLNAGPNNELYLDDTAALAFVVNATDAVHTLQIEAKLVDVQGTEDPMECSGLDLRVLNNKNGSVEETKIDTVCSSTAMYYRIPVEECISLGGDYYLVAILGNSDFEKGGSHVLSFSNLKHKNYTIGSPYDTSDYDAGEYLAAEEEISNNFVSVNLKTGLKKNAWQSYNDHRVTLTQNVFGDKDPEFTMYYMKADGDKVKLSVTAKKVSNDDKTYQLRFKTPNAKGNFPVEIHYVIDGQESGDYISTTMKVTK